MLTEKGKMFRFKGNAYPNTMFTIQGKVTP